WKAFACPKQGNAVQEYEDYCGGDPRNGRFAIADGASESSFARAWARLLVKKFLREPVLEADQWAAWLAPLQEEWGRGLSGLALPWFAKEKAELGAFATFLGLLVQPDWTWRAVAVGDSCLFHVRGDSLIRQLPDLMAGDFGTTPALVSARL